MPVIKSAKKRLRADLRKKVANQRVKTRLKSTLKSFSARPSRETLNKAYSILDVAAKKNVIPKGRADRKKRRLAALLSKTSTGARKQPRNTGSKKRKGDT
ncbi:MAG TPA: 30S ribosomal protein S20 [Candidatus Nanoarchaeia archaeon]